MIFVAPASRRLFGFFEHSSVIRLRGVCEASLAHQQRRQAAALHRSRLCSGCRDFRLCYSIVKEQRLPGQRGRPWVWSPEAGAATAETVCIVRADLEFRSADAATWRVSRRNYDRDFYSRNLLVVGPVLVRSLV